MKASSRSIRDAVVTATVGAFLVLFAVPSLWSAIESSRLHAAARRTVTDLRDARARAIASGWQCKIVGYGASSHGPYRNRYRLLARHTAAVPWPADGSPVLAGETRRADPWLDVSSAFPGVEIDADAAPADGRFEFGFDSRGLPSPVSASGSSLRIAGSRGACATIDVSSREGIVLR
jgi:hypothetical protein